MITLYLVLLLLASIFGAFSPILMLAEASMIAHVITHISLTGIIIANIFNANVLLIQCVCNVLCALLMSVTHHYNIQKDAHANLVTNAFLSFGLTIAYLYSSSKVNLLSQAAFNNFVISSPLEMISVLIICIIFLIFQTTCSRLFFSYILNAELSMIYRRQHYRFVWLFFYIILGLLMTISRYIIGPMLCLPILIGPGAIAWQWVGSFRKATLLSIFIALLAVSLAILSSLYFPVSTTAGVNCWLLILYYINPMYKLFMNCYNVS